MNDTSRVSDEVEAVPTLRLRGSLELVGDADAGSCVDGVCAVPS